MLSSADLGPTYRMLGLDQLCGVAVAQVGGLRNAGPLVGATHVVAVGNVSRTGVTLLGSGAGQTAAMVSVSVVRRARHRVLAASVHGVVGVRGVAAAVLHGHVVAMEALVVVWSAVLAGVVHVVRSAAGAGFLTGGVDVAGDEQHDGEDDGETRGGARQEVAPAVVVLTALISCLHGHDDNSCSSIQTCNKCPDGRYSIVFVSFSPTAAVVPHAQQNCQQEEACTTHPDTSHSVHPITFVISKCDYCTVIEVCVVLDIVALQPQTFEITVGVIHVIAVPGGHAEGCHVAEEHQVEADQRPFVDVGPTAPSRHPDY